jgi:hypothetical protein
MFGFKIIKCEYQKSSHVIFRNSYSGKAPKFGLPDGVQSGEISDIPAPSSIFDLQFAVGASSYAPGK